MVSNQGTHSTGKMNFFPAGKIQGILKFGKIQGNMEFLCLHSKFIALEMDGGHSTKQS